MDDEERLPQFFSLTNENSPDSANAPAAGFLAHLPDQLDPASLQQQAMSDHLGEVTRLVEEGLQGLEKWVKEREKHTTDIYRGLLALCVSCFEDPKTGEPYQIFDKQFNHALSESFLRTAPRSMWLGMWVQKGFQNTSGWVQSAAKKSWTAISPFRWWREGKEKVKEGLSKAGLQGTHIQDPESLASAMHDLRWTPAEVDESTLRDAWTEVLIAHAHYELPVDPEALNRITTDYWNGLSPGQRWKAWGKSLLASFGTLAALGGFMVAAVDGGATLFASYSLAGWLASTLPHVPALTLAVIGTGGAFSVFYSGILKHNTLPALSAFFSLACDAFQVPRRLPSDTPVRVTFGKGNDRKEFLLPDVEVDSLQPVCPLPSVGIWELSEGLADYRQSLTSIRQESSSERVNPRE